MLLSLTETAALLNADEKKVLHWIRKEGLPACKVNDEYRLNKVDLLEWATEQRIKVSPEIFADTDGTEESSPPLSRMIKAGGVFYDVAGDSKEQVLRTIVGLLDIPPAIDRDFMLQVLLAREALGTTAIGDGIAIPHVRNPILLRVDAPTITLCFLKHPIDFKAVDEKPVDTLFTLITPSVKLHLHLLAKLAYVLRDPRFKTVLQRQGPASEILAAVRLIESEMGMAS
jgi:PTS system nitrogen regulatory IIA component